MLPFENYRKSYLNKRSVYMSKNKCLGKIFKIYVSVI